MSISSRIRQAARRAADQLSPWALDNQRIHSADVTVMADRGQYGEIAALADAYPWRWTPSPHYLRLPGAAADMSWQEYQAAELGAAAQAEPGNWTPPADPRLDSFGPDYDQDYALATPAEREQLAVYGVIRTPADPAAESVITTGDPWAEEESAWTQEIVLPLDPKLDPESDQYQPQLAAEVAWEEPPSWNEMSADERTEYLGVCAAEMAEADSAQAAAVIDRMGRDGLPGDRVAQVVQTAALWRENGATAEAGEAEVRHTAGELSRERGELIWPDQVARAQDRARAEVARQAAEEREAAEWRDRNAEADPYANRDLRGELAEEAAGAGAIEVTRPDGDKFITRHADLDRARLLYREADGWSCRLVAGQHDAERRPDGGFMATPEADQVDWAEGERSGGSGFIGAPVAEAEQIEAGQ